ncbi:hypothetical protein MASSI9I_20145 [Massilia sp. 9I]|nr:hypothetical protein MASSI9I_20145 [Massilia sp. 9I]
MQSKTRPTSSPAGFVVCCVRRLRGVLRGSGYLKTVAHSKILVHNVKRRLMSYRRLRQQAKSRRD